MEWRCEWCGKPHEENDPPCDNCGHGSFERAVAPVAPEGEGGPTVWICTDCGKDHPRNNPPCSRCGSMKLEQREQTFEEGDAIGPEVEVGGDDADDEPVGSDTMTVWVCTDCGKDHPRNNPPCGRCGGMHYERREVTFDEAGTLEPSIDVGESESDPAAAAADGVATTVWACTECGRVHTRNNPPCSRCGNMQFEQREQRFDDLGPGGDGWRDVVDWKILLGFIAAVVLAVLLIGPALGYFDLPGGAPPSVADVPGEGESVGGVALDDVERRFVDRLGDARSERGANDLSWNRELGLLATYENRWRVKTAYGGGEGPSEAEDAQAYRSVDSCRGGDSVRFETGTTIDGTPADGFGSADAMARALVDVYGEEIGDRTVAASYTQAGADVHVAPDGRVFVTVFLC